MERILENSHDSVRERWAQNAGGAGTAVLDPAPREEGDFMAVSGDLIGSRLSGDSEAFVALTRQESGE